MANGVAICSRLRREEEAAADQYHRDANELEQLIVKEYNGAPLNEREAQLVQKLNSDDATLTGATGVYCKYGQNVATVVDKLSTALHDEDQASTDVPDDSSNSDDDDSSAEQPTRARRSSENCWKCVCTTGTPSNPARGSDASNVVISGSGTSIINDGASSTVITSGRCGLHSSSGTATCNSIQTC
jgi:hypothetical protein